MVRHKWFYTVQRIFSTSNIIVSESFMLKSKVFNFKIFDFSVFHEATGVTTLANNQSMNKNNLSITFETPIDSESGGKYIVTVETNITNSSAETEVELYG